MRKIFFLFVFIFSSALSFSQTDNIPDRPSPQRMVNNLSKAFPDFISASEQSQLENKLVAFNDSSSNQIAIVIIDDLAGMEVNQFATQLFNKWGIGRSKNDNGVLLLVKPKTNDEKGEVYIATGRGLEAVIPDITANHIVQEEIIPEFKNGNYFAGINAGVDKIMGFARGEFNSDEYSNKGGNPLKEFKYVFIAIIIILIIVRGFRGGGGMTMSRMGIGYLGGGFFGGGGFGRGGGGGGGFGGFGGGSSGGGGAGGSW